MQTNRSSGKWLGFAVVSCAACCAVPIAAVLGLGGAAAAAGALLADINMEMVMCLGVLGLLMAVGIYLWVRARRQSSVDTTTYSTACKTDASCCNPSPNSNS
jgi:membrane protein implicated in regulation of membrane protease activity